MLIRVWGSSAKEELRVAQAAERVARGLPEVEPEHSVGGGGARYCDELCFGAAGIVQARRKAARARPAVDGTVENTAASEPLLW